MIGPIKRDLGGLSDTEISLIIGLAFSLVYTLADRALGAHGGPRQSPQHHRGGGSSPGAWRRRWPARRTAFAACLWRAWASASARPPWDPASTSLLADYFENAPPALGLWHRRRCPLHWHGPGQHRRRAADRIGWRRGPTSHCHCSVSFTPGKWCWSAWGCRASSWRR